MKIARYGWRKDRLDPRDWVLGSPRVGMLDAVSIDLRSHMPPVYDQGNLGSCTANGLAAQVEFLQMKFELPAFTPSRLFIYWCERHLEGTISSDAGAEPRDGVKVLLADGAPPESMWPYDEAKFAERPPQDSFHAARKDIVTSAYNLKSNLDAMRACLHKGYPFSFGFTVYSQFENIGADSVIKLPDLLQEPLGGHFVVAVGCDDASRMFVVRNSWGPSWGEGGHCYMPYAYLANPELASDFWTLRSLNDVA